MRFTIPRTITFPFGYVIRVRQYRFKEKDAPYARWRHSTRTIELNTSRPLRARRADLIHELQHAILEWASEAQQHPKVDVRS